LGADVLDLVLEQACDVGGRDRRARRW
jgi:hypothetical protein